MIELQNYLQDGAGHQARAVLMHLQAISTIESSWNDRWKKYDAVTYVSRWQNCREQGYVLILRNKQHDQLNIAFFEHRNSDRICAILWKENTINSPTVETAQFGDIYKDKYDISHSVSYGQYKEMAEWIATQLKNHYEAVEEAVMEKS